MLSKITCPLFNHGEINFHQGLNLILGDDDAKNSIGKSSALMVIDFAMGGSSLLEDKAGVIKALGHHTYNFEFIFDKEKYFLKRSTSESNVIHECNKDYDSIKEISIDEYTKKLKDFYALQKLKSSFRSLVGPFIRIWNKGALDPNHPFSADTKEPAGTAIGRLIDLFSRTNDIEEEKSILDTHNEKKKLISKSMAAEIIPKINKTQYKTNQKKISENTEAIEALKKGFSGALSAYEALFDEKLRELQHRKIDLIGQRNEAQTKIDRVRRDLQGVTPRLTANIALIQEFFPNIDIDRLQQVEFFHQNISKIVQRELKKDLASHTETLDLINTEILNIEKDISSNLAAKGTPDDLFARVFDLKEITDKASEENRFYDQKAAIEKEASLSKERLDAIYITIFLDIESSLNSKLKNFNKVVYGANRNASQLRIKNSSSYSFISSDDTGTGKSYAGLVGFDLAAIALTPLPFLIHDSVIYKNIEVPATRNILRILASIKRKQIFLAFDEAVKFGATAEKLLHAHTVLKLSDNDLLYKKDWREQNEI
ncbi:chromosome partitioning protein ParA [Pectobacterium brasiliense]|uniref:DUF2326 domain-containing protein n=2 Tax=Pectobacterium TaxID=122277 RepID=A0AAW3SUN4_9GAMM|nr:MULTISPECIES: DUF2326 domain-containing protein [Pectobacterium]KHS88672.1 chromosome partitioning protein ParA [Pectobacterium brasiliense]MBA5203334.1 DUF2326 domain-containing protein [Pectobacterium aroidearum]MBN3343754.1 DUF2326 domain-containing protein [Pectobacterium brasiliense]URG47484.1 DUF2326 domain-containing protein [Pectobacterium quasiaquaticum]